MATPLEAETLTWYKTERAVVTGSNIPSSKKGNVPLSRYSGKMVHGKFQGLVVNVDASGQTFHGTFVNGSKTGDWIAGTSSDRVAPNDPKRNETPAQQSDVAPPAAGPPALDRQVFANVAKSTPSGSLQAVTPPSSLREPVQMAALSPQPSIASPPPQSAPDSVSVEPVVRNRIISDFKDETQSVLFRVRDATENFREVERLDSIQELPGPIAESVDALTDRARDFRAKLGYETAMREYRNETQAADALSIVDRTIHDIASSRDASRAEARLTNF